MSNDYENEDLEQDQDVEQVEDELTSLKRRADLMGITYHPSIGLEKLREKVKAAQERTTPEPVAAAPVAKEVTPEPVVETIGQQRMRLKKEATKLVRIRLTCMNPAKSEWDGEFFSVGNSVVGTVTKYVPFNNDEGWHVPHIIYEQLLARKCIVFTTAKGTKTRVPKEIKEFAIEVLPPLTTEELRELATQQAVNRSIDSK